MNSDNYVLPLGKCFVDSSGQVADESLILETFVNSTQTNHAFLRLYQIVGDPRRGVSPLLPISRSSWWQGIKDGRYPAGLKLGPKTTVWRKLDIDALLNSKGERS